MDGGNNDIYSSLGNLFEPLQFPFNVAPQVRVAPTRNPPVEGAVPPVMAAAPAGNVPVVGAVPPAMAAAAAGEVPVEGAAPVEMAAPARNVPVLGAVPVSEVPPVVTPATGDESGQGTGGAGGSDTSGRKKRGRPRKYGDQGNLIGPSGAAAGPSRSGKKGRGRAAGSGNLKSPTPSQSVEGNNLPLSMVGWGFTPHVIMVDTGEDIAVKIATFAVHNGPKGICVLSASGLVSNVLIRQLGVSDGILRYEGLFQIMALSGSFSAADDDIRSGRAGGLSVALAGADGRIIGGGIAGALVAACPMQVLVGTFMSSDWMTRKGKSPIQEPASSYPSAPGTSRAGAAAPAPPANPGANIFDSPSMQAGHVLNPGANLYSSAPTQTGHLASNNEAMRRTGLNNPAQATVQRTPPADMNLQAFRRG